MKVFSDSEIGQLNTVIVHRPDAGISRISPKRAEELLFDDIVHLPKMQDEHDIFTSLLEHFVGKDNVLETQTLLEEALVTNEEATLQFLELVLDFEELPESFIDYLKDLEPKVLAKTLITGYLESDDRILFDPIPNFIFTRDIAVTVNDNIIIMRASKAARHRENWLTRFILRRHPLFSNLVEQGKLINLNDIELFPPSRNGELVSVEGGDVMIINKDYLLVGTSERTTTHAINALSEVLFEKGIVKHVAQLVIPAQRSFMHIDTLFTQIDHNHIVCYKPIVYDGLSSYVNVKSADGSERSYHSIKDFFHAEINPDMEFIFAGQGKSPYQEREQWTDGCNLVAVKPGVALTYDRNPFTEQALAEAGYKSVNGEDLLKDLDSGKIKLEDVEKTIINIPSNELSRARGGSHCMTCPIHRNQL